MRRRRFLSALGTAAAVAPLGRFASPAAAAGRVGDADAALHLPATASAPDVPFPSGRRPPFGWPAAAIPGPDGPPTRLAFPSPPAGRRATAVRFAVALDFRDRATVEVASAATDEGFGTADVRFTQAFQPFSVPLAAAAADAALRDGLTLRVIDGKSPLWILGGPGENLDDVPDALRPHLLFPGSDGPWAEFFRRFGSLASVQPWGWMEGCVLDGLLDLAERPGRADMRRVAERHLALFTPGGVLTYEDGGGRPVRDRASGIESTLPFAALARLDPDSPVLDVALRGWAAKADADGLVSDDKPLPDGRRGVTAEGSYTVGYPMAAIGQARGDEELMDQALTQVRVRQAALFDGADYVRVRRGGGSTSDRGWARGVAWHLLGSARTLAVLRDRPGTAALIPGFVALADWAVARQLPADAAGGGLWSVFLHEPTLAPDTSGSAGIAAALAIGVNEGWLGAPHAAAADRCREALTAFLTPDGFLGGVAQANKGGRGLQAGDYRVLYQMGMGLAAQLIAAREAA